MDQRIKKLGIPKSMFSYKTNNSKSKEKSPNDFWKDCENEKMYSCFNQGRINN